MAGYRNLQHSAKNLVFLKGRLALLWGVQVAVFSCLCSISEYSDGVSSAAESASFAEVERFADRKTCPDHSNDC